MCHFVDTDDVLFYVMSKKDSFYFSDLISLRNSFETSNIFFDVSGDILTMTLSKFSWLIDYNNENRKFIRKPDNESKVNIALSNNFFFLPDTVKSIIDNCIR